jgi:hypothetical protein
MITLQAVSETLRAIPVVQIKPLAHVGIRVPAIDHSLVEPVYLEQGAPGNQLKVARTVVPHVGMRGRDLIEV